MDNFASRLRIGEKIGLGFALVGLLYLAAIWQYHQGQAALVAGYEHLQSLYVARIDRAFAIQTHFNQARLAEARFLLQRQEDDAALAMDEAQGLIQQIQRLASDEDLAATTQAMSPLASHYLDNLTALIEAWRIKGLNEDSGQQGNFRRAVHELQQRSRNFNAGELYVTLLQMRRSEKDLLLRGETQYAERVRNLIDRFRDLTDSIEFYPEVRQALLAELDIYAATFEDYARTLAVGNEVPGGKGPFRDAAHRLEAILAANYVPGLETTILQMRRREKDYLMRRDVGYVQEVRELVGKIRDQIAISAIDADDQAQLLGLLEGYERHFLALVAQNDRVTTLTQHTNQAAATFAPLSRQHLDQAGQDLAAESLRLAAATARQERINLLVVLGAVVLGILFTFLLARPIVRPVREMAGLLDRLTHESPSERIPTVRGARDEINAMAKSLNTLANHRTHFVKWWKAAMAEATALRKLHEAAGPEARDAAVEELRQAALSKLQRINRLQGQLLQQSEAIDASVQRLRDCKQGSVIVEANRLANNARELRTLLEVLS
jgi:methyl-accepting chemotaxis protein